MGPYRGGQAELLRVPWADFNCLKLPGQPGDALEDDFLLLSDVFPTGYHATELACVRPGSTVAVFGAGPVGLLAGYSALLRGAAEVYVVDSVPERLEKVKRIGRDPHRLQPRRIRWSRSRRCGSALRCTGPSAPARRRWTA